MEVDVENQLQLAECFGAKQVDQTVEDKRLVRAILYLM